MATDKSDAMYSLNINIILVTEDNSTGISLDHSTSRNLLIAFATQQDAYEQDENS